MSGPRRIVERLAKSTRDWRVRVLVPVMLVNLAAFAGLYTLMDRYSMSNLVNTHKFGAALLLDELELDLHQFANAHNRHSLAERLSRHAGIRDLLALSVYDRDGNPIVSTRGTPAPREAAQARVVLLQPQHPAMWLTEGENGSNIFGVRALKNGETCRRCHAAEGQTLGAIQLGIDMTAAIAESKTRVRRNFLLAGAAWTGLLGLMFWSGGVVIGRPLARLEKSMTAAGVDASAPRHDLDALAHRVHDSIWNLIRTQRQRDEDLTRHMARAEQLASLGQIAAGLTHEIKNPLAGIAAALELLRDEHEGQDTLQVGDSGSIYDQMLAELRRVSGTVDSLLRLGKPQPPQRSAIDLARLVREVTSLFTARLRRQGVELELQISDVPMLSLDSSLMVQLLMNLLTNGMQATDRGGLLTVFVAPFPRHDGVVLAVSDTGRGIAPADLDRIFDPFFTTKEEGTGLGLPICRQIVEQHGGTMQVESELGKGTRVMVLLPDHHAAKENAVHGFTAAG